MTTAARRAQARWLERAERAYRLLQQSGGAGGFAKLDWTLDAWEANGTSDNIRTGLAVVGIAVAVVSLPLLAAGAGVLTGVAAVGLMAAGGAALFDGARLMTGNCGWGEFGLSVAGAVFAGFGVGTLAAGGIKATTALTQVGGINVQGGLMVADAYVD